MPAPRDLTGQRFGKLTALRRNGRVKWGHEMAAWLCRCDCGTEVTVPQKRLTTKHRSHQYHACDDCRTHPCTICGAPIPGSSTRVTCGAECDAEKSRRYQLAYYHEVRVTDPSDTAKRRARGRAKWAAMSPERKLAESRARRESEERAVINARAREAHERRMMDPDYAERRRAQQEVARLANPDRYRSYTREHRRRQRETEAELDMLRLADLSTKPQTETPDDQ